MQLRLPNHRYTMTRLALFVVCCAVALVAPAIGKTFVFQNQHGSTVWIGTLGNAGLEAPNDGGFALNSGDQVTVTTADDWAGRFWARTGCNFNGNDGTCETGDCGNVLACNGAGGVPPVSLAEFTLNGYGDVDYYDVSFVDGYNVGLQVGCLPARASQGLASAIQPQTQSVDPNNQYSCGVAGCLNDLNSNCPDDLRQTNDAGDTVACKSACLAFDTDQYCCRGDYGTSDTCQSSTWPQNYPAYFKDNCPNAYSYAYDDTTSTYTCSDTGYTITVG
ncbi:hypothetical protein PR048_025957 [Dryococelus australis]|uniref:Thaumatin-like protein n=1 Tax=Dryococelus australis TaxID=614101 RepID=A0ABQ9GJZ4_9NEOP|nr:hypothetical protein PR048_025957 [Dryococelus australis]